MTSSLPLYSLRALRGITVVRARIPAGPQPHRKSEGLAPSGDIVVDFDAHNTEGPLGVSVRGPVLPGARQFVDAAVAAGIPKIRTRCLALARL